MTTTTGPPGCVTAPLSVLVVVEYAVTDVNAADVETEVIIVEVVIVGHAGATNDTEFPSHEFSS